jgi:hypothetical protein
MAASSVVSGMHTSSMVACANALVVAGRLNKQVGGEFGISEITVKAHGGKNQ